MPRFSIKKYNTDIYYKLHGHINIKHSGSIGFRTKQLSPLHWDSYDPPAMGYCLLQNPTPTNNNSVSLITYNIIKC